MRPNKECLHAFTLIELLVVISIISLLSSSILTAISDARNKARIAANKQFEQSIRSSISDCSIAFYNFEDSSTSNVLEAGGTGPDGTLNGNPSRVESVNGLGRAIEFDGVVDYVSTPLEVDPNAIDETTWSAWIKPDLSASRGVVFSDDDGGFDRGLQLNRNGNQKFNIFTGSGAWSPAEFENNEWQFVAVTYTNSNVFFFKDGKEYTYGSSPVSQDSSNTLNIGRNPGFGEHFDGIIDNVRIYNCGFHRGG